MLSSQPMNPISKFKSKGGKVKPQNVYVVRNGPNLNRLVQVPPNERLRSMNKGILCYIGCLNPQDGVDYLLRSLQDLAFKLNRKDFYCTIIGSGDSLKLSRPWR